MIHNFLLIYSPQTSRCRQTAQMSRRFCQTISRPVYGSAIDQSHPALHQVPSPMSKCRLSIRSSITVIICCTERHYGADNFHASSGSTIRQFVCKCPMFQCRTTSQLAFSQQHSCSRQSVPVALFFFCTKLNYTAYFY